MHYIDGTYSPVIGNLCTLHQDKCMVLDSHMMVEHIITSLTQLILHTWLSHCIFLWAFPQQPVASDPHGT